MTPKTATPSPTPDLDEDLDQRSPSHGLGTIPLEDYLELVGYDPMATPRVRGLLQELDQLLGEGRVSLARRRVRGALAGAAAPR